jgi:cell division septation protein DedD
VAQVDPICADLQGKIGDLGQDPEKQAADVQEAVNKIKAVPVPNDDDQRARLYIAAMENLYLSLQDVDQSRRVNDQTRAAKALEGAKANNETAAKAAKAYGMVECAQTL